MKILLVNKFHYLRGGSETYYFSLADALINLGHEVIFFSMQDEKNLPCEQSEYFVTHMDLNEPNRSIASKIKITCSIMYSFEAERKMDALIKREKPDAVLFNLVHKHITLSIINPIKRHNIPIGFMLHDYNCICPNYLMLNHNNICMKCLDGNFNHCIKERCVKDSFAKSIIAAMEAWTMKALGFYHKVDFYLVTSEYAKELLIQAHFTTSPIIQKSNPLPPHHVIEFIPSKRRNLLFLGRLSKEKGILTLLKSMSNTEHQVHLNIAGDGEQREELEHYVKQNELEDRIHFLGFLTGEALTQEIAACRCVVVASECFEGGPYTIIEAFAKGKPVISTNIVGFSKLIADNVNGYLYPPGDSDALAHKINQIMNLPDDTYRRMCMAAIDTVREQCDIDDYSNWLVDLFQKYIIDKRINS